MDSVSIISEKASFTIWETVTSNRLYISKRSSTHLENINYWVALKDLVK